MLEKPLDQPPQPTAAEANDTKFMPIFIGVFALVLFLAFWWSVDNDRPDVVIIDDSPNVVVDDEVTISTTDSIVGSLGEVNGSDRMILQTEPYDGLVIDNEEATVTNVLSDRYFIISWDPINVRDSYVAAYLTDDLDLGSAEYRVVVKQGDVVAVSGVFTTDYENLVTADGQSVRPARPGSTVLLVNDIKFRP